MSDNPQSKPFVAPTTRPTGAETTPEPRHPSPPKAQHRKSAKHTSFKGRPGRATGRLDNATVRRVLERDESVRAMESADLQLAARLLGCDPEPSDVVESSLVQQDGRSRTLVKDLTAITDAESDMDALVAAIELKPDRLRGIRALVAALSGEEQARPNQSEAKAARQVATNARGLSDEDLSRLRAVVDLVG